MENNYKLIDVLHLLDEFLAIDPPNADADRTMAVLTLVLNKLGINKTIGPVTELEYLGIIIDSIKMEARLPKNKVERI